MLLLYFNKLIVCVRFVFVSLNYAPMSAYLPSSPPLSRRSFSCFCRGPEGTRLILLPDKGHRNVFVPASFYGVLVIRQLSLRAEMILQVLF